jgi:hypothetical protein
MAEKLFFRAHVTSRKRLHLKVKYSTMVPGLTPVRVVPEGRPVRGIFLQKAIRKTKIL